MSASHPDAVDLINEKVKLTKIHSSTPTAVMGAQHLTGISEISFDVKPAVFRL
jgi:hypothetical protein